MPRPPARTQPVAASASVEYPLIGLRQPATVVAATPQAVYLRMDEAAPDDHQAAVICLANDTAVRVPCAVVLGPKSTVPTCSPGAAGVVGGGVLEVAGSIYRVARWWRPPRPRSHALASPAQLAATMRWVTGRVADPLDAGGRRAVAALVHALVTGSSAGPAVAQLMGRGSGLTPIGDDVLAGALVGLTALGSPAARPLATTILGAPAEATNVVSAALLRHATRGECVPELAALVASLADPAAETPAWTLPRTAGALLALGHCSGAGLLHGVLVALAIARPNLASNVLAGSRPGPVSGVPAIAGQVDAAVVGAMGGSVAA